MDNIVEKIMEIVRQLPVTDQLELRKELLKTEFNELDPSILDTASQYIGIMNGIVKEDVRTKHREENLVNARIVLSHFLYQLGLTYQRIGQLLGKNHATVIHYRKRMDDALGFPQADPKLMLLYNKFLKEIQ